MKTTKFELSKSCHGMTCIQAVDCSEEQLHSLHGIITNNWMPGDDYKAKQGTSPFIQVHVR